MRACCTFPFHGFVTESTWAHLVPTVASPVTREDASGIVRFLLIYVSVAVTGRGRVVLPCQRGLGLHYEWQREGGPCVRGGLWTSRSIPVGLRTSSSPPPGRLQTEAGPRPSAGSLRGRDCAWTRCRLVSAMPCLPSVGGPTPREQRCTSLTEKVFLFFLFNVV